jgi:translation initiation factor IF-2
LNAFKHFKKDINEASKGLECGMAFENFTGFAVGDKISAYQITKVPRKIFIQ